MGGDENHRKILRPLANAFRQFAPVHTGHDDVGYDQIDVPVEVVHHFKGPLSRVGFQHAEAAVFEDLNQTSVNGMVVYDKAMSESETT